MEEYKLIHDTDNCQYRYDIDAYCAVLDYRTEADGVLAITHVGVPQPLEGKGIASKLVQDVLIDIKSKGLKIRPICPFVVTYVERHPEWRTLSI